MCFQDARNAFIFPISNLFVHHDLRFVLQSMDVFVYHIRLQNLKNPKESNSNVFNSARGPIENSAPRKVLVHTQSLLVQTFSLTVFVNTLDH
eukprot:UN21779